MVFSGLTFIYFFLPTALFLYYITPKRHKNLMLTVLSLFFYAWGEPIYISVMLFSTLFNYANGLTMSRCDDNPKARKVVLVISVCVNLAVLCFFKYTEFFIENINHFAGSNIQPLKLSLPIGISFYTFQTMSYSIDVYRRTVKANKSLTEFAAYVTLFPQLIAGPIVRYVTVEKQLRSRTLSFEKFADGCYRFCCGMAKKVLLANNIGVLWDALKSAEELGWASAWLGITAFTFQIYFDFSGYSDMAIGLGKMLGFDFNENFDYPYLSKSVTEFWRRWHISLGSWFRDYVYIPLGGNRVGRGRFIFNILFVWTLTGLWHGASWNFILWGVYYGTLLLLEKLIFKSLLKRLPGVIRHIYTMLLVIIGWVLFASDNTFRMAQYLKTMFTFNTAPDRLFLYYISSYFPLLIVLFAASTPLPKKLTDRHPQLKPLLAVASIIVCTAYLVNSTYNPFLYFRF